MLCNKHCKYSYNRIEILMLSYNLSREYLFRNIILLFQQDKKKEALYTSNNSNNGM